MHADTDSSRRESAIYAEESALPLSPAPTVYIYRMTASHLIRLIPDNKFRQSISPSIPFRYIIPPHYNAQASFTPLIADMTSRLPTERLAVCRLRATTVYWPHQVSALHRAGWHFSLPFSPPAEIPAFTITLA